MSAFASTNAPAEPFDVAIAGLEATIANATGLRDALIRQRRIEVEGWLTCDDCPYICRSERGMKTHRGMEHPPPLKSFDDMPTVRGMRFRCEDGTAWPTLKRLAQHTHGEHGRLPTKAERTPIEAT